MQRLRRAFTYPNVLSSAALFLALGGGSYAAVQAGNGPADRASFRIVMTAPANEELVSVPGIGRFKGGCAPTTDGKMSTNLRFIGEGSAIYDVVGQVTDEGTGLVDFEGDRFPGGSVAALFSGTSAAPNAGKHFTMQVADEATGKVATVTATALTRFSGSTDRCLLQGEVITG